MFHSKFLTRFENVEIRRARNNKQLLDLDGDVTTRFSDEFRECLDGIVGVLTHVNLQS